MLKVVLTWKLVLNFCLNDSLQLNNGHMELMR